MNWALCIRTHPQDFWLFRIKMCIHYASFARQNGYYNPGIITRVWKQRNLLVLSPTGARSAYSSPGILPGHCTMLSERVPRHRPLPPALDFWADSRSKTVKPRRRTLDTTGGRWRAHRSQVWNMTQLRQRTFDRQKGGVVGLNEAASVRVGSIRHPSVPSIPSIPSSLHRSLSTSQMCRSSFHSGCQAG